MHINGLLFPLALFVAALAFPRFLAELRFGLFMLEIVTAYAMGASHGGDRDVNTVVALRAALVDGILKALHFPQMTAVAFGAAHAHAGDIMPNASGAISPFRCASLVLVVAA